MHAPAYSDNPPKLIYINIEMNRVDPNLPYFSVNQDPLDKDHRPDWTVTNYDWTIGPVQWGPMSSPRRVFIT